MENNAPSSSDTGQPNAPERGKRKLRNLLIDKNIQLRFTFTSMLIVLLVSGCLAFLLHWQNQEARQFFARQRAKSTAMFKRQLLENRKLVQKILADARRDQAKLLKTASEMLEVQLKDKDPMVREAAKLAKSALDKDDKERLKRRKKADALLLKRRQQQDQEQLSLRKHQDLEASILRAEHDRDTLYLLGLFCLLMLFLIFFFTIILTHRVAGPLFKIGRYFDEIADGKLTKPHDLRKGDLIKDFHQRFKRMHEALEARTKQDIEVLEAILSATQDHETSPIDDALRARLQALLDAKRASLS